jgi:ribose transport system ATP-binding protein
MISSDLPEVLGMSDRIAVVYEGRLKGILATKEATQEKVMTLATGGTLDAGSGEAETEKQTV